MKIERHILQEYLDGELPPDRRSLIEQALRNDATAASLLTRLQTHMALRAAALQSYTPSAQEAAQLTHRILADLHAAQTAPLARIGSWLRPLAAIAAVLLLAAGCFYAGRLTASPNANLASTQPSDTRAWTVVVQAVDGSVTTHEFASLEAAQKFAEDAQQKSTVVADSGGGVF